MIYREVIVINDLINKEDIKIENMIYEIRGKQVMLDSDLAKLYHVETKRINEAVKNNMEKFPERFSFILTNEEAIIMVVIDMLLEFSLNKVSSCLPQY